MADNDTAISLINVSKVFKRYHRPVDRLKEILSRGKQTAEEFWALQDINLKIPKGETLGVIGRNGSGKSTLLQIIAGTLQPTRGMVNVNGRVAALLELGSGFNPDFTGRQNIFFNGQILGLRPEEIECRFEDIAAFADIGDFIEQPVKTYSSGMVVRLAFSIYTQANPDVFIVDEALAVGDEEFQRKCFSRIRNFQAEGKTILFVSHASQLIIDLCHSTLLLDDGVCLAAGESKKIVNYYQLIVNSSAQKRPEIKSKLLNFKNDGLLDLDLTDNIIDNNAYKASQSKQAMASKNSTAYGSGDAQILEYGLYDTDGQRVSDLVTQHRYILRLKTKFFQDCKGVRLGFMFKTLSGFDLGGCSTHKPGEGISVVRAGSAYNVEFQFTCNLRPSSYFANINVTGFKDSKDTFLHRIVDAFFFKVSALPALGNGYSYVDYQTIIDMKLCKVQD